MFSPFQIDVDVFTISLSVCVRQLKEDFVERKSPITDDSEVLRRFCAKLEYLLQYEMKGTQGTVCWDRY